MRVGYGFRLGGGAGVFFGGGGAALVFVAIGSAHLALWLLFAALGGLLVLARFAGQAAKQSPGGRRRLADPYVHDAVRWEVADGLSGRGGAPLWGVYEVDGSFFTGRHPRRKEQLRAAYPDRADRVIAVAAFPSGDLARACARGLRKHGFTGRELMDLYGYRVTPVDGDPRASGGLPGAAGA
jgi:hypothetical protein